MSIQQNFPAISPSLSLNFARSKTLDPRITFTRTSTATRVNGQGLIEVVGANTPRFDHKYENGVVKSLGLLVEEARTNSLYYSNDFSQNPPVGALQGWLKQNSHPVPTQSVVGPDGVSNSGWRFYRTATNQYIYQQVAGAGTHTLSAWVRSSAATGSFTMQGYNGTDAGMSQQFTATNEWKRFSITISPTTTTNYYPCIPTNINTDFYVWGAQLELNGSFPTSYIPTTNSTATRTADIVSMVGENFSSWYNPNEGTFFTSFRQIYNASATIPGKTPHVLQAGNATTVNDNYTIRGGSSDTYWTALIRSASPSSLQFPGFNPYPYFNSTTQYKAALSVNSSLISVSLNGLLNADTVNTTTVNHTTQFNKLFIGSGTGGGPPYELCGHISQLTYYPRRLSNEFLQNLTK